MQFSQIENALLPEDSWSATRPSLSVIDTASGTDISVHAGRGALRDTFSLEDGTLTFQSTGTDPLDSSEFTFGGRRWEIEDRALTDPGAAGQSRVLFAGDSGFAGDLVTLLSVDLDGRDVFVVALHGRPGLLTLERQTPDALGVIAQIGDTDDAYVADPVTMAHVRVDGASFILAASSGESGVSAYRMDAAGQLEWRSSIGAGEGLGIDSPTVLRSAVVDGKPLIVLASAGTGSLSVLSLDAYGALALQDHKTDDLSTRFSGVTLMDVVEVDGRTLVVAAGADDGVSVFSLLPNGRLIHMTTLEHGTGLGLENPTALQLVPAQGGADVYITSGVSQSLTWLRLSLESTGNVVMGGEGADTLAGGAQDDILYDGGGADQMQGGDGSDIFVMSEDGAEDRISDFDIALDRIDLSAWSWLNSTAQLSVTSHADGATLRFRDEVLVIETTDASPLVYDDFLARDILGLTRLPSLTLPAPVPVPPDATIGADMIHGGPFSDVKDGLSGNDTILGEAGHDTLSGGAGDDRLQGGTGGDHLMGGDGHDLLYGESSVDLLEGGRGDDTLHGGTGADTLWGGDGDDSLLGNTGVDEVHGGDGNDWISPGNGADKVWGDAGDDMIIARTGWDTIWGGDGNDSLFGSEGQDILHGDAGDDYLSGGFGFDTLFGGDGNDQLFGNLGSDAQYGGAGHDSLYGATGNDTLDGGSGDDVLYGSQGVDVLTGGTGDDDIWGGSLADTFVFHDGHGSDRIHDFELHDRLLLDAALVGGRSQAAEIVETYAQMDNGDIVFDFGSGDMVRIEAFDGFGALTDIIPTIEIF